MEGSIRPFKPGDEHQILTLFKKVFGADRSLEHWRWKFQDNPAGCNIYVAVSEGGEIVGHYAAIPAIVARGNERYVFSQVVDVMVDPEFRRGLKKQGIFARVMKGMETAYGVPDRVAVGYGFPTPEHFQIGQRLVGYNALHPVLKLTKGLASGRSRSGRLLGMLWNLSLKVHQVERFDPLVDQFWERCRHELPLAIVRDARYLNWRYAGHPDVSYRLLIAARRGEVVGVAVLRIGWLGQSIAALVDWLVPEGAPGVAEALLDRGESLAGEAGMEEIQAWFPSYSAPFRLLLSRGYRSEPTLYSLVCRTYTSSLPLEWLRDHWYYTMGDSDIY